MKQQTLENMTTYELRSLADSLTDTPSGLSKVLFDGYETTLQDLNDEIEELKGEVTDLGEQLEEMEEQDIKQNNCLLAIREELESEVPDFDVINSLLKQAGY